MPAPGYAGIRQRISRLKRGHGHSGLLSVEELAALSSVGFEQVSEVIGAVAYRPPETHFYIEGLAPITPPGSSRRRTSSAYRTFTSSRNSAAVGTPSSITALRGGYQTALERLVDETVALGADGVVGVKMTYKKTSGERSIWSFLAVGTAIRSVGHLRAGKPFTTALSGARTASAIGAGWVPITFIACPVMAIRGIDQVSSRQLGFGAANGEVDAFTDAVNTCRHQARADFAAAARAVHADAAVMENMTLRHGRAHGPIRITVELTGTALARFDERRGVTPFSVLPLDGSFR